MKNITNVIFLGQKVTADLEEGTREWVRYTKEEDGSKYMDVIAGDGRVIYSDGEQCEVMEIDTEKRTVTLFNDMIDSANQYFTIPQRQYFADFTSDFEV